MTLRHFTRFLGLGAGCVGLLLAVAGCASTAAVQQTDSAPLAAPATPRPTPTATVSLSLRVHVVAPGTHRRERRPTWHWMQVVPRTGPYLLLFPSSGPPLSRAIALRAGRLPARQKVTLVWTAGTGTALTATSYWTDAHGSVAGTLILPGAEPGAYRVVLEVNGIPYAWTPYEVTLDARLRVLVEPGPSGGRLVASGVGFLPYSRLALLIQPVRTVAKKHRAAWQTLAVVETNRHGSFSLVQPVRSLPPGQYMVQTMALDGMTVQSVQTYLSVII